MFYGTIVPKNYRRDDGSSLMMAQLLPPQAAAATANDNDDDDNNNNDFAFLHPYNELNNVADCNLHDAVPFDDQQSEDNASDFELFHDTGTWDSDGSIESVSRVGRI
jgi:hypothetical protein